MRSASYDKRAIKINLNLEKIGDLRYSIDSKESLINLKKVKTKSVWTRIRVILCRLEDTSEYVNTLELGNQEYKRAAFDFYDFINNASVIIDCIKEFAEIFTLKTRTIEVATDVFNMIGDGSGNDGKFFKYIRSLTSAHPLKTSYHAAYHGENNEHSCYYVTWSSFFYEDARDLSVFIYSADENKEKDTIGLKVNDFKKYLNKWICFIDEIIVAINSYSENKVLELISQRIKTPNEFDTYIEYLQYLKEEMNKRYNYNTEYMIDSLIKVFSVKTTNSKNIPKLELYRNAIQYSVSFLHKRLQDMNGDDTTNTGILFPEPNTKTELYLELARPYCMTSDVDKYRYSLGKLMYLSGERSVYSIMTARSLLDEMKDWLNGYVVFTNHESNEETIVLVRLAQYLDCLSHKSTINKNIPNDLKYRERLLL